MKRKKIEDLDPINRELDREDHDQTQAAIEAELAQQTGGSPKARKGHGSLVEAGDTVAPLSAENTEALKKWDEEIFEDYDDTPRKAWSTTHNRPVFTTGAKGNVGNRYGSRRRAANNLTVGENWFKLFSTNELPVPASQKLTDEELAREMERLFPENPPLTLKQVKVARQQYNAGSLWCQRTVEPEGQRPQRVDPRPPQIKSRKYIRLEDGRVFTVSPHGRYEGEYQYEAEERRPATDNTSDGRGSGRAPKRGHGRNGARKGRTPTEHGEGDGVDPSAIQNAPEASESP